MASPSGSGPFHFRSGTGGSSWDLPADEEGIRSTAVGGKLLGSPRQFTSARRGLGVAWTGVEDRPPEPPDLTRIAPLLGQNGQIPQSKVAVDSLVEAAELVGTLRRCSGNTPERRGSLPMSRFPPRGCGLAGCNLVMSLFPFFLCAPPEEASTSAAFQVRVRFPRMNPFLSSLTSHITDLIGIAGRINIAPSQRGHSPCVVPIC